MTREKRSLRHALTVALLFSPWIAAPKCFPTDPRLIASDAPTTETPSEEPTTEVFIATPCADPQTAQILIQNFAYIIVCGCQEPPWPDDIEGSKTCTIPSGTRVIWTFSDSEEHNVQSEGGTFEESGDQLVGTFSETFGESGTYSYRCGIHSRDMNGYAIVVK